MIGALVIERNLGNVERLLRLLCGIGLGYWAFSQPSMNGIEWFVVLISSFLIMNGVFSRCYLWYILDLNSHKETEGSGQTTPNCR